MVKPEKGKKGLAILATIALVGNLFPGYFAPKADNDPAIPAARETGGAPSAAVTGQVNPFSGTFSTSIPIETPPGRSGMQPALTLSYGSTNSLGVAGVGWDIPASSITRTGPRRGTPTYGYDPSATDEFYLNLNGTTHQLLPYGDGSYHTRVETWSRVTPYPTGAQNPQYWVVQTKSGEKLTFGDDATAASESYSYLGYYLGLITQPARNGWMLKQAVDVDGNTMDYTYTPTAQCSTCKYKQALLPATIRWGANTKANFAHFAEVSFSYDAVPPGTADLRKSWNMALGAPGTLGIPLVQDRRLHAASAGTPAAIRVKNLLTGMPLRSYDLTYITSTFTNRSLLASVTTTYHAPDGTSYAPPAVEFTYSAMDEAQNPLGWSAPYQGEAFAPGLDFASSNYKDGDDKDYPVSHGATLMDVNGDGLPEYVVKFESYDAQTSTMVKKIWTYKPNAAGWSWTEIPAANISIPGNSIGYIEFDNALENLDQGVRFADVNGDGLPDKLDYCANYRLSPTGKFPLKVYKASTLQSKVGWEDTPLFGDEDFAQVDNYKGLPFSEWYDAPAGTWHSFPHGTMLADVNGDGIADKIDAEYFYHPYEDKSMFVRLGTGSGRFSLPVAKWEPPVPLLRVYEYYVGPNNLRKIDAVDQGVRLIDLNGDGLPDFVKFLSDEFASQRLMKIWWNTGAGWAESTEDTYPASQLLDYGQPFTRVLVNNNHWQANDKGAMVLDVNGDGLPDKIDRYLACYVHPAPTPEDCGIGNDSINSVHINRGGNATESGASVYFSTSDTFQPWVEGSPGDPLPDGTHFTQKYIVQPDSNSDDEDDYTTASRDLGLRVADLNGDGYPDFIKNFKMTYATQNGTPYVTQWRKLWLSTPAQKPVPNPSTSGSARRDYLISIKNPLKGVTEVNYGSAADFYGPYSPTDLAPPRGRTLPWVVKSVTLRPSETSPDAITTSYAYYGPSFDVAERQVTGFRRVVIMGPENPDFPGRRLKSDTYYYQEFPRSGMVEASNLYDELTPVPTPPTLNSSSAYVTTSATYAVSQTVPDATRPENKIFHVHKETETKTEREGGARTSAVKYENYDAFDNPGTVLTLGDTAFLGDEKRVESTFINDSRSTAWLLGYVSRSTTYSAQSGGAVTSDKKVYYDDSTTWPQTTLSAGKVTREDAWLDRDTHLLNPDGGPVWVTTGKMKYLAPTQGGMIQEVTQPYAGATGTGTEPGNLVTTFEYTGDPTRRFATRTTKNWNEPGNYTYSTSSTYDIWGRVLTVTDVKGGLTTTSLDAMGRPTQVTYQPSGYSTASVTKKADYSHAFDATAPYVKTQTTGPVQGCGDPVADLESRTYYDGLGRVLWTIGSAWNGNYVAVTKDYEANTGRLHATSRPFFAPLTDTKPTAGYMIGQTYDARWRVQSESGFAKTKTFTSGIGSSGTGETWAWTQVSASNSQDSIVHWKRTWTDVYGRVRRVEGDAAQSLDYSYDVMGSLVRVKATGASSDLVTLTYDSWGHKLSYKDADSTVTVGYCYDWAGRLIQQVDNASEPAGSKFTTKLRYNEVMAQLSNKWNVEDASLSSTYDYGTSGEDKGEIVRITDTFKGIKEGTTKTAKREYTRSSPSVSTVETKVVYTLPWKEGQVGEAPVLLTFRSVSDRQGNAVSQTLPDITGTGGVTFRFGYDPSSGMLAKVQDGGCAGNTYSEATDYSAEHLEQTKATFTSAGVTRTITTDYRRDGGGYPEADRLTSVVTTSSSQGIVKNLTYTYRGDDLVREAADVGGEYQAFAYDGTMRLTCFTTPRGTKTYGYEPAPQGPAFSENLANSDDRVLAYDPVVPHRVVSDSMFWNYTYDGYGRLYQAKKSYTLTAAPPNQNTRNYDYDGWHRLYRVRKNGTATLGSYEYFGDGERFKKAVPSGGATLERLEIGGFEVEQIGSGFVRYRWAVPGVSGLACWKQNIVSMSTFAQNASREGEYTLAGMAFDRAMGDGRELSATLRASLLKPRGPEASLSACAHRAWDAASHLASFAAHGAKGFTHDEAAQGNAGVAGFAGLVLVAGYAAFSRRAQARLEALLRRRGGAAPAHWVSFRARRRGYTPSAILRVLLPAALLRTLRWPSDAGSHLPSPTPSPLAGEGRGEGGSLPRPLAPWSLPAFRFAARVLVVVFVAQAGLFMAPVQTQATPLSCMKTFIPVTDHLGTVSMLLDETGAVVYRRAFYPFGTEDPASSTKPSVCNNGNDSDPWPYGFTGQEGDAETGLIYMHARYYHPGIAHFMTPDSVLGDPGDSFNYDRYAYCRNNPVSITDPTGHFLWWLFWASTVSGAWIGGAQAGASGGNVGMGMLLGALSGAAMGAGAAASGVQWYAMAGIAAGVGAANAAITGGNVLRDALLGAVSSGLGSGVGTIGGQLGLKTVGQKVFAVMAGGVMGGLTSVAGGGMFAQGFLFGAAAAGASMAVKEIAGTIEMQVDTTTTATQRRKPTQNIPPTESNGSFTVNFCEYSLEYLFSNPELVRIYDAALVVRDFTEKHPLGPSNAQEAGALVFNDTTVGPIPGDASSPSSSTMGQVGDATWKAAARNSSGVEGRALLAQVHSEPAGGQWGPSIPQDFNAAPALAAFVKSNKLATAEPRTIRMGVIEENFLFITTGPIENHSAGVMVFRLYE